MSDDPREHLRTASDRIAEAAEAAEGDTADRLSGFAERVEGWADQENGPDHGALANILLKLDDLADEVGGDAAETIQTARSEITEFRKTVGGV
ncbi:DUF7553 family protein [Haloglomus salinum]|jgi:hypothetical protein|uniref:DUF7553 family protein n=1 Tax=Haloglomus salinum TaxID=2962673 RepID=UPI0020C9E385|nr:hypothetical protein [Haloglomus salinum]